MSAASSFQWPQDAGSTYVVMPTTGLATLEHPLPLVGRHDLVIEPLLGARVIQIVIDDLVTEQRARHRSVLESRGRVAQRARETLDIGLVRVAFEGRPELELLLDAVQPGREEGAHCEVRVRVG